MLTISKETNTFLATSRPMFDARYRSLAKWTHKINHHTRSCQIRVGPKSSMTSTPIRKRNLGVDIQDLRRQRQRSEWCVYKSRCAQDYQQPPRLGGGKKGFTGAFIYVGLSHILCGVLLDQPSKTDNNKPMTSLRTSSLAVSGNLLHWKIDPESGKCTNYSVLSEKRNPELLWLRTNWSGLPSLLSPTQELVWECSSVFSSIFSSLCPQVAWQLGHRWGGVKCAFHEQTILIKMYPHRDCHLP